MSERIYQQIECKGEGGAILIVWAEARAFIGADVTFKETGDLKWRVTAVYGTPQPLNVNRGWGLDLPKSQRTETVRLNPTHKEALQALGCACLFYILVILWFCL